MGDMSYVNVDGLIADLNYMNTPQAAELRKALDSNSGYDGYSLEAQVKRFLPAYTVLRNRFATDTEPMSSMAGKQAHYKAQLGFGTFNFPGSMGTAFGGNGTQTSPAAVDIAPFIKTQSINASVELEAIDFARGFDDPIQANTLYNIQAVTRLEELLTLGGNYYALAAPVPTGSQSATTGTAFNPGAWTIKVTALTLEGKLANDTGAATPSAGKSEGESTAGTVTVTVTATAKGALKVSWPVVNGAAAYKVYCSSAYGDSTDVYLLDPATELGYSDGTAMKVTFSGQKWIGVNSIQILHAPAGVVACPTVDGSANTLQFEGALAWCTKTSMYGTDLSSYGPRVFTDMGGQLLNSDSSFGVKEINDALQSLWTYYHTGPTIMVGAPQTIRSITNRIASQSMTRIDISQSRNRFVGGAFVGGYANVYVQDAGFPANIDLIAHPYMPTGMLLLLSESLPMGTYRNGNDPRCWAMGVLKPYTFWKLASTDRHVNFDIYFQETLKCYYPLVQGAIAGIRVDS